MLDVKNAVSRHKFVVGACIVVITSLVTFWVSQVPNEYVAGAMLSIENRKTKITDLQTAIIGGSPENMQVVTESEILRAPTLAVRVVDELNLRENEEFNPQLKAASPWRDYLSPRRLIPAEWLAAIGQFRQSPESRNPANVIVDNLLRRLTVVSDPHSFILKIEMRSRDPVLAATLANTYAEAYLAMQAEAKERVGKGADAWLRVRLDELHDRSVNSERAVERYREEHKLFRVGPASLTLVSQRLAELNAQLTAAAADRAQKEANLSRIKSAMASPSGAAAAADVLSSPLIQKLSQQQAELTQREASLATKLLPQHPAMVELQSQIEDSRRTLTQEISKIVSSLSTDLTGARAKEAMLKSQITSLVADYDRDKSAELKLADMQREAAANQKLYEEFLERFNQVSAQKGGDTPDALIVSKARVPDQPAFPRPGLVLGLAILGSSIFGVGLALLLERLDRRVRSERQIEAIAGIPATGLVPAVKSKPIDMVVRQPRSAYSEAIRAVGAILEGEAQVVLVTSAIPGEGKSVIASSLARSMAYGGRRVLLVDCDLRRPVVGQLLDGGTRPGVQEAVMGEIGLEAVICEDSESGLAYIAAGHGRTVSEKAAPPDILGSARFAQLIKECRKRFDLIVLDAPPVLLVSDPLLLERVVDTTMLVVRWASTSESVVGAAMKKIRMTSRSGLRVVLSRVDLQKHIRYEFGRRYHRLYDLYYEQSKAPNGREPEMKAYNHTHR